MSQLGLRPIWGRSERLSPASGTTYPGQRSPLRGRFLCPHRPRPAIRPAPPNFPLKPKAGRAPCARLDSEWIEREFSGLTRSSLILSKSFLFETHIVELIQAELKGQPIGDGVSIQPNLFDDRDITMPVSRFLRDGEVDKNHHQVKKAFNGTAEKNHPERG